MEWIREHPEASIITCQTLAEEAGKSVATDYFKACFNLTLAMAQLSNEGVVKQLYEFRDGSGNRVGGYFDAFLDVPEAVTGDDGATVRRVDGNIAPVFMIVRS